MPEINVEKELLEATNFKPKREYPDRQDYLAAVARATDDLSKDDFDALSNEAADWFNAACEALNDKDEIPDFDGTLGEHPSSSDQDKEPDDEDEGEDVLGNDEEETDEEEGEVEPAPKAAKPNKKAAKPTKAKPEPAPKAKKEKAREPDPSELKSKEHITFDQFGLAHGTQNAEAVAMLQKGCRMKDITNKIGGTYYNVLRRLVKEGHVLEKRGDGTLQLIHRDDVKKPKAKKE